MKLNEAKISEIRKLRSEGNKQKEIAKVMGVSVSTISYWLLSEEKRRKKIEKGIKRFKGLSKEQRRKAYEKRKDYMREYQRRRYNTDEEFRIKHINRVKGNNK